LTRTGESDDVARERLIPGRTYRVQGRVIGTAKADAEGRALIAVDLDDRLEVTLRPAPARSSKKAPAKASAGPKL
jgi:hypothetical protein